MIAGAGKPLVKLQRVCKVEGEIHNLFVYNSSPEFKFTYLVNFSNKYA